MRTFQQVCMECGHLWFVPPDPETLRASYCMECSADGDETIADMRRYACQVKAMAAKYRAKYRRNGGSTVVLAQIDVMTTEQQGH